MRIHLLGESRDFSLLEGKIEREGDEVVEGEDVGESGLVVSSNLGQGRGVFYHDIELPQQITEVLGLKVRPSNPDYFLSRWWDGEFSDQTLLSFPSFGLMNYDLGPQICTGCCSRFVDSLAFDHLFTASMGGYLKEIGLSGFVSIGMTLGGEVTGVWLGLPFFSLFNLLECSRQTISETLSSPNRFLESWTASVLISRSPFPYSETSDPTTVEGIPASALRHLWLYPHTIVRKSPTTSLTRIAVSSSWHQYSDGAEHFAYLAAWGIEVEGKQFRTDVVSRAIPVWKELQSQGI